MTLSRILAFLLLPALLLACGGDDPSAADPDRDRSAPAESRQTPAAPEDRETPTPSEDSEDRGTLLGLFPGQDAGDAAVPPPEGEFLSVSAGDNHTCALRTDATVACWGWNGNGRATPPEGEFTAVSAGGEHTCGVRADGAVVCWGELPLIILAR